MTSKTRTTAVLMAAVVVLAPMTVGAVTLSDGPDTAETSVDRPGTPAQVDEPGNETGTNETAATEESVRHLNRSVQELRQTSSVLDAMNLALESNVGEAEAQLMLIQVLGSQRQVGTNGSNDTASAVTTEQVVENYTETLNTRIGLLERYNSTLEQINSTLEDVQGNVDQLQSQAGVGNETGMGDNETEMGDNETEMGDNETEMGDNESGTSQMGDRITAMNDAIEQIQSAIGDQQDGIAEIRNLTEQNLEAAENMSGTNGQLGMDQVSGLSERNHQIERMIQNLTIDRITQTGMVDALSTNVMDLNRSLQSETKGGDTMGDGGVGEGTDGTGVETGDNETGPETGGNETGAETGDGTDGSESGDGTESDGTGADGDETTTETESESAVVRAPVPF
jgi:hypothetical protein